MQEAGKRLDRNRCRPFVSTVIPGASIYEPLFTAPKTTSVAHPANEATGAKGSGVKQYAMYDFIFSKNGYLGFLRPDQLVIRKTF